MGKAQVLILGLAAVLLVGCGEQGYGGTVNVTAAESQQALQKQIDDIQKNDHMPPQAKEAAIANLRSRMQSAAIAGKGMNGPGK